MTTPNYRLIAAQKFVGCGIYGTGRWAVQSCDKGSVWLCPTEECARAAALGGCYVGVRCRAEHAIFDLEPKTCPLPRRERKDDYEDREWLRRQSKP